MARGVLATYASGTGYALLDRRLYLPALWCEAAAQERHQRCGVPEEAPFHPQPALAQMLQGLVERQEVQFRWVWETPLGGMAPCAVGGGDILMAP